ncbi:MAG TPA: HAMP domain-containing sensor histidine kinase [Dermatophilaceae bacterium]|nr:HAMP domain-containing sensor histidine kinase [Dermatophilaceae bacterium]
MNRLVTRLVLSHAAVAIIAGVATMVIVRQLAPLLFDERVRRAGQGAGLAGILRQQFASAVDQSLVVGVLIGVVAATVTGAIAAYRLVRPLGQVREAARRLADGDYQHRVPLPHDRELADLAHDVNELGKSLSETEVRRTALISDVAHELRTPLTVIDGYLEGMIDDVIPTTPAQLALLQVETRRLRRLAEDLSTLSRADEGRLAIVPVDMDLAGVASGAAARLAPQAADAGITLDVRPAAGPVVVCADPDRVSQIVTNLVGNAIHATPPGGTITVGVTRKGERALVTVSDTGVGLSAGDLARVFERFYRAPGSAREHGSGVGLTIARMLARGHGGEVYAASPGPGLGATFTLDLPMDIPLGV